MIRILVYTVEPVLALGFQAALQGRAKCHLVAICTTLPALLAHIADREADVVLLDVTSGITYAALTDISRAQRSCKVVLWAGPISTEFASQAVGLGVSGILRKVLPVEVQLECLERVHGGELWFE